MNEQGILFSTDDSRDRSFEYKRAQKAARKENTIGRTDLIIKLPYIYSEKLFIVSRTSGGKWHCQACPRNPACKHIKIIHKLLQLKVEAGYEMSDVKWLKQVLVVGEVRDK